MYNVVKARIPSVIESCAQHCLPCFLLRHRPLRLWKEFIKPPHFAFHFFFYNYLFDQQKSTNRVSTRNQTEEFQQPRLQRCRQSRDLSLSFVVQLLRPLRLTRTPCASKSNAVHLASASLYITVTFFRQGLSGMPKKKVQPFFHNT